MVAAKSNFHSNSPRKIVSQQNTEGYKEESRFFKTWKEITVLSGAESSEGKRPFDSLI